MQTHSLLSTLTIPAGRPSEPHSSPPPCQGPVAVPCPNRKISSRPSVHQPHRGRNLTFHHHQRGRSGSALLVGCTSSVLDSCPAMRARHSQLASVVDHVASRNRRRRVIRPVTHQQYVCTRLRNKVLSSWTFLQCSGKHNHHREPAASARASSASPLYSTASDTMWRRAS